MPFYDDLSSLKSIIDELEKLPISYEYNQSYSPQNLLKTILSYIYNKACSMQGKLPNEHIEQLVTGATYNANRGRLMRFNLNNDKNKNIKKIMSKEEAAILIQRWYRRRAEKNSAHTKNKPYIKRLAENPAYQKFKEISKFDVYKLSAENIARLHGYTVKYAGETLKDFTIRTMQPFTFYLYFSKEKNKFQVCVIDSSTQTVVHHDLGLDKEFSQQLYASLINASSAEKLTEAQYSEILKRSKILEHICTKFKVTQRDLDKRYEKIFEMFAQTDFALCHLSSEDLQNKKSILSYDKLRESRPKTEFKHNMTSVDINKIGNTDFVFANPVIDGVTQKIYLNGASHAHFFSSQPLFKQGCITFEDFLAYFASDNPEGSFIQFKQFGATIRINCYIIPAENSKLLQNAIKLTLYVNVETHSYLCTINKASADISHGYHIIPMLAMRFVNELKIIEKLGDKAHVKWLVNNLNRENFGGYFTHFFPDIEVMLPQELDMRQMRAKL